MPSAKLANSLRFFEYAPKPPLSTLATLARIGKQLNDKTGLSLVCPKSSWLTPKGAMRKGPELDAGIDWVTRVSDILRARVIVIATGAELTTGERDRSLLAEFVERLRPTGRILVVVSSFILFALTTRPDTLMLSLVQRGVPGGLAYIIVATIQLVPRIRARAASILDAQRARGLETTGSLRRRLSALVPLVVPLVLSSLVDVEERALAIEARAFNHPGPKTSLIEITEAGWERPARWLLLLTVPVCLGLRLWLG